MYSIVFVNKNSGLVHTVGPFKSVEAAQKFGRSLGGNVVKLYKVRIVQNFSQKEAKERVAKFSPVSKVA